MKARFLRALAREPVDATPVWMMRQAGRYLPEYRATRARAGNFLALCKTPELACEVTLQPLARYPLDAAILFSDILTIPDAMGLGLSLDEGVGPRFARRIEGARDVAALGVPDPEVDLRYVMDAVRLIRRELAGRVPLIGFAGSPWTLATYMVEGGSSREFHRIKAFAYGDPGATRQLLDVLTEAVTQYLAAQAAAGAEALMVFDTWGGALTPTAFRDWSLDPMARVVEGLRARLGDAAPPVILYTKSADRSLEALAATGCAALGIDWTVPLGAARQRVGHRVALQGNLDPDVLYAPPEAIRAETCRLLDEYGPHPGHICNLGHGITPGVDPEHARAFIETVHDHSRLIHAGRT